jgi:large subunit ribosomal protein L17
MRHRRDHRKLSRTASHRKALLRSLVTALFMHERIETTLAKAKEARRLAERLITFAKRNNLHSRRLCAAVLYEPEAVQRLFDVIAPLYATREGGYTRILKSRIRLGDAGQMGILELVKTKEQKDADRKRREEAEAAATEAQQPKKRGLFGGRKKKEEGAEVAVAETATVGEKKEGKTKAEKKPRKVRAKDAADKGGRNWMRGKSGPGSSPRKTRGSQRGQ